jgi:endonuclease YncB( thermonuclease family)
MLIARRPATGAVILALLLVSGCAPHSGSPASPSSPDSPFPAASQLNPERPRVPPVPDAPAASSDQVAGAITGVVTHVVDGDTVDVSGLGRVRVIGIDTPERGACGFETATWRMAQLVEGKVVTATPGATSDQDRYDRYLRYIDVAGRDAGLTLIEDGLAIARYDSRDGYGRPPREDAYIAADAASPDPGC